MSRMSRPERSRTEAWNGLGRSFMCTLVSLSQTWKCSSSTSSKNHSASGGNRHPGTVQAGQAALDLRSTLRNPKVHTFQILTSSPLFWEINLTVKHSPWLLYLLLPHLLEQRCKEDPLCPTPWQTPPSPSGVTSAEWELMLRNRRERNKLGCEEHRKLSQHFF